MYRALHDRGNAHLRRFGVWGGATLNLHSASRQVSQAGVRRFVLLVKTVSSGMASG
jgi:hypothetical protein